MSNRSEFSAPIMHIMKVWRNSCAENERLACWPRSTPKTQGWAHTPQSVGQLEEKGAVSSHLAAHWDAAALLAPGGAAATRTRAILRGTDGDLGRRPVEEEGQEARALLGGRLLGAGMLAVGVEVKAPPAAGGRRRPSPLGDGPWRPVPASA